MTKGLRPATIAAASHTVDAIPRAPLHLSPAAKKEWRQLAPILVARRVLTEADLGSLEGYVMAMARVREAEKIIARDGAIIINANKDFKRHPAATLQDAALKTARLFANELGLTPISRSRTAFPEAGDADELDDLD